MRQSRNQVERREHVRPVHACPRSSRTPDRRRTFAREKSQSQQFGNSQDMWISTNVFFFSSTSPLAEYVFRLVLHAAWYHVTRVSGEKRKAFVSVSFFGRTGKKLASLTRSSVWTCFWSCSRRGWRGWVCSNVRLSWRTTQFYPGPRRRRGDELLETLDLDQVEEYYIWQAWSTRRCLVIRWCKLNFRLA